MKKNIATTLLILSVITLLGTVGNLVLNFSFENGMIAMINFLVTVGLATLEQHFEGVEHWSTEEA